MEKPTTPKSNRVCRVLRDVYSCIPSIYVKTNGKYRKNNSNKAIRYVNRKLQSGIFVFEIDSI